MDSLVVVKHRYELLSMQHCVSAAGFPITRPANTAHRQGTTWQLLLQTGRATPQGTVQVQNYIAGQLDVEVDIPGDGAIMGEAV